MNQDIYITIKGIAVELVNSTEYEDTKKYWDYYHQLEKICLDNENSQNDHPFQWESLGDFTTNNISALKIYTKALELAERRNLKEYSASINFAIAVRYRELGNNEMAFSVANRANATAIHLYDFELCEEISQFLVNEN